MYMDIALTDITIYPLWVNLLIKRIIHEGTGCLRTAIVGVQSKKYLAKLLNHNRRRRRKSSVATPFVDIPNMNAYFLPACNHFKANTSTMYQFFNMRYEPFIDCKSWICYLYLRTLLISVIKRKIIIREGTYQLKRGYNTIFTHSSHRYACHNCTILLHFVNVKFPHEW